MTSLRQEAKQEEGEVKLRTPVRSRGLELRSKRVRGWKIELGTDQGRQPEVDVTTLQPATDWAEPPGRKLPPPQKSTNPNPDPRTKAANKLQVIRIRVRIRIRISIIIS